MTELINSAGKSLHWWTQSNFPIDFYRIGRLFAIPAIAIWWPVSGRWRPGGAARRLPGAACIPPSLPLCRRKWKVWTFCLSSTSLMKGAFWVDCLFSFHAHIYGFWPDKIHWEAAETHRMWLNVAIFRFWTGDGNEQGRSSTCLTKFKKFNIQFKNYLD